MKIHIRMKMKMKIHIYVLKLLHQNFFDVYFF